MTATPRPAHREGRLLARPEGSAGTCTPGLHEVGADAPGDALLLIPDECAGAESVPLVVLLHGAGGNARNGLQPLLAEARREGVALLAPASRGATWDLLQAGYGPDVAAIDAALAAAFAACPVDPARLAIGGFSDGASYALSLGLTNGDLFSRVVAFSPGFMRPATLRGRPRIFISHGAADSVLPIDRCSRRIVPELLRADYEVHYAEFSGGHTVPAQVARAAIEWLADPDPTVSA